MQDVSVRFPATSLDRLFDALRLGGFQTIGPKVEGGAIVYDEIAAASDLPIGWGDIQEKGSYRLRRLDHPTYFGFNASPDSWKKVLYPSRVRLWQARREKGKLVFAASGDAAVKLALVGVRACDLHAIAIQRHVRDTSRRDPADGPMETPFIVAVSCAQAAATCFCASMGTGPGLPGGADLELAEFCDKEAHYFIALARTARGADVLAAALGQEASAAESAAVAEQTRTVAASMTRRLNNVGLDQFMAANLENPHWDEVAQRCLSCANCTLVCPTCFCTTTEDVTDLSGENAERWLKWDSCFNLDFSHLHGGSVRQSTRSRYRQWLTHKLGTWFQQFGSSGCVGCGRCIAWCPVGIDLTEEVPALKAAKQKLTGPGRQNAGQS